eukprot:1744498-Pyramimonas_sp.AAC.1
MADCDASSQLLFGASQGCLCMFGTRFTGLCRSHTVLPFANGQEGQGQCLGICCETCFFGVRQHRGGHEEVQLSGCHSDEVHVLRGRASDRFKTDRSGLGGDVEDWYAGGARRPVASLVRQHSLRPVPAHGQGKLRRCRQRERRRADQGR